MREDYKGIGCMVDLMLASIVYEVNESLGAMLLRRGIVKYKTFEDCFK